MVRGCKEPLRGARIARCLRSIQTGSGSEPPDIAARLDRIGLYLGQVCRLAGISKMQLDYWTNKAQIPTGGKKQRIYDRAAIETVLLIKQGRDKGLNLTAAIEEARRFREGG